MGKRGFDLLMQDLRMAIVTVNSTRVDLSMAEGLATWIQQAMNHLKEWAGMGALAVCLVAAMVGCLLCLCRIVQS